MKSIVKKILDTVRLCNGAIIHAIKNDYNSRYIKAVICTDGTPNNIENGSAITVSFKRKETGEEKTFNGELNADGTAMVPITQWALGEIGVVSCWISVSQRDGNLTTLPILIEVHESGNDNGQITEDDPEYNDILSILARLSDHDGKIEQNSQDIEQNAKLVTSALEYTSRNSKRITNLEQRLDASLFVTDNSVDYAKIVPEGALPYAEVAKIGGMSYRDSATNTLKHGAVTSIKATGKNLIPFPYYSQSNTSQGITFAVNANGSITVKGTCIADTSFALFIGKIHLISSVRLAGVLKGSGTTYYLQPYFNDKAASAIYSGSYTYSEDLSKTGLTRLMLFVKAGAVIDETIYPMLSYASLGGIDYEPYKEYSLPIPASVQALNGYRQGVNGTYNNYIEWKNGIKTFNKYVDKVIIDGTYAPVMHVSANGVKYAVFGYLNDADMVYKDSSRLYPSVCNKYPIVTAEQTYNGSATGVGINHMCAITAYDKNLQTEEAWQAKLQEWNDAGTPLELVYAIKTPIVTDISDLLPDDNFIEVSEGGLVIAENAEGLDVPTTIAYQIKGVTA